MATPNFAAFATLVFKSTLEELSETKESRALKNLFVIYVYLCGETPFLSSVPPAQRVVGNGGVRCV